MIDPLEADPGPDPSRPIATIPPDLWTPTVNGGPPPAPTGEGYREGPTFLERLLSTKDFCAVDRPPPEPLCGPLLYRGRRLVVAGETGAGKSTWSYQLTKAIAHEEKFLGWNGAGGRGLILDFEQDEEDIEDLLTTLGLDESENIDILSIPYGIQLDKSAEDRRQLEEVFAAGGYSVVLLDPLFKVFGGDSTNEREAVDLMRHFDFWRQGAAGRWPKHGLIVPMHARKPPPKAPFTISEVFGSTAWVRGAENVYGIRFVNQGFSQLYAWKMRSHRPAADDPDSKVTLQRGDIMGMTFKPGDGYRRGASKKEKAIDVVRRLLSENPEGWTVAMLQDAVPGKGGAKAARATIDRALKELGDEVVADKTTTADGEKLFRIVNPDPVVTAPDDADLGRWESMAYGDPDE